MADAPDTDLARWVLGGATALLAGLLKVIWTRQGEAETRHEREMREVWTAITADRNAASAARERTLERLADMPTKADLARLEDKITTLLAHRTGSD